MSNRSDIVTDPEFDEVSSFSSVDSYKPEPFVGFGTEEEQHDSRLFKNDTILNSEDLAENTANTPSDLNSKASSTTLGKRDSNAIERVVTKNAMNNQSESADALRSKGLDTTKRRNIPDINAPLTLTQSHFPEEYQVETETGLVKMKTIESLKSRHSGGTHNSKKSKGASTRSKNSLTSSMEEHGEAGLNAEKLNSAVERNRKELERYEKNRGKKGIKGFLSKMFQ
ncbi:uncharacterized protein KNAG_0B00850 [Huiozyma naganishii CBS 8797]|uniref:Uncharacterized protein n=1 Tax=Huiozyma naganishii (strain ATCC MYA-139 / BCRC 22969 / CBS 8797 / KCTC 17520 / NBRC 10181 / NCYC 3082 / Yp74L-3) TaxID=1071383 RepID=J7RUM5_HUIN7|nr:hypothetical protein KNAG_0B00850 [Kazachstania naganishii CBS 8797]CCK68532.1 hypothetical protein KNAG_0B00850 [Kazachstania naganishii CBS 8797]